MADPSTDFLKIIYSGKGYDEITGRIDQQDLLEEIRRHDRVFMLGHGGPSGLFGPGYVMSNELYGRELAKKQDGLYIWCHAVEYAHKNKLNGLVSGMFISEVGEAAHEGIKATQAEIDASNNAFSRAVRQYLDTGASPHSVQTCYNSATCKVTQYNNARLYVMRGGRIIDTLGQEQPDEVSAKPGSPRYWKRTEPQQGAYGDLDEPPDEFKTAYGWDNPKNILDIVPVEYARKLANAAWRHRNDLNRMYAVVANGLDEFYTEIEAEGLDFDTAIETFCDAVLRNGPAR